MISPGDAGPPDAAARADPRVGAPAAGAAPLGRSPGPVLACFGDGTTWLELSSGAPGQTFPAPVVGTLDWRTFRVVAPLADCAIILLPIAHVERHAADLRRLLAEHPLLAVVVATSRRLPTDIAGALRTRGDVLALPLEPAHVWAAAQRAGTRALLQRAGATFATSAALPVRLRRALGPAAAGPAPVVSVAALAVTVGCHRRTLWRGWRGTALGAQGLALDEVLDWLLLFRAYLLRAAGHPWSDVAGVIGVHRHTLAHLVHRLAGVGLRDFSADTVVRARSTFIRAVMDPLGAAPRRK